MKVEISVHALNLKNVAGVGKGTSDPFCVITKLATVQGSRPEVLGKTEVVKNSLSPQFVKSFVIDYELGTPVKVAVSLFDLVKKGENKSMGSATFDVGEVLGARGNTKAKGLRKGGSVFLSVRKSQGSGMLRLKLKGNKLKNVEGMFSKSDPFFELSRKVSSAGAQTWDNVYRSKHIKNNLNPDFDTAIVEISKLCGGDLDLPILVSVYDHESSGKHISMGQFETSVNGLQNAHKRGEALALRRKGKEVGTITVTKAEVSGIEDVTGRMAEAKVSAPPSAAPAVASFVPGSAAPSVAAAASAPTGQPDFIDYVSGGCELNVMVAIDFTGSNGDPRKPGTLHYLHKGTGQRNDYERAIAAILNVLGKYDTDQQYPVVGFGAKYGGVVRHCFQCGGAAEVHGVDGVLNAYHQVFSSGLIMSGPTVFTEVFQTAAARAMSAQEAAKQKGQQAYTILLVMTDGAVSDVGATAAALEQISDAPLSIVIVGVGSADFSAMQFLDDAAKPGKRDIAQFVEFNKHSQNSVQLTSETLHEIPDQLVGYFQSKGIQPLPALMRTDSTISVGVEEEEIDLSLDIGEEEIVVTGGGDDFVDGFNATR